MEDDPGDRVLAFASKGRTGVLASLFAAILIGSANALIRFFSGISIG